MKVSEAIGDTPESDRARDWKKMNFLVNSQLQTDDALKILSNGCPSIEDFRDQFISGKYVVEVAGGGYTDLVDEFRRMGAMSVVTTDIVEAKCGSVSGLHLRVDMNSLSSSVDDIRRMLSGNLPDTIVGTSFFGNCSLSLDDSRCWLKECCRVIAPGGVIIVDFMNYRLCPTLLNQLIRTGLASVARFERMLEELKNQETITCWKKSPKANPRIKYRRAYGLEFTARVFGLRPTLLYIPDYCRGEVAVGTYDRKLTP